MTLACSPANGAGDRLPLGVTFKGADRFQSLVKRAERENWRSLPIGARTAAVGLALVGTPYKNYTLEIHDRIEAPSANLDALDCWTFYEISLGFARMLTAKPGPYSPRDLLALIELERYRGGRCDGEYLSRIHFLEELYADNEKRGLMRNITRSLGGERMDYRRITEMTVQWKSYRYLRNNPGFLGGMDRIQAKVSSLPVWHVPRGRVASAERGIHTGDIISITTNSPGGYTTHVGLAYRDRAGTLRFMHASSLAKKVVVDARLSSYIGEKRSRAGVMIGRPFEVPPSVAARLFGNTVAQR
jgi:hypothetical protein